MQALKESLPFATELCVVKATTTAFLPAQELAMYTEQPEEPSFAGHKRDRLVDASTETWAAGEAAKKFNLSF